MKGSPENELIYLVNEARRIAKLAGETVMNFYQLKHFSPEFLQIKEDSSPVTEADLASHRLISEELRALKPSYPIISEEGEGPRWPIDKRQSFRRLWIVDPLDGTKEFLEGNGEFAIHIGLIDFGIPVGGVVYLPVFDRMYFAVKNGGAFCEENNQIRSLRANQLDLTAKGVKVTHSRSHMNEATKIYINSLDEPICTPLGSSLKIMEIAEGRQDIYPKINGNLMEWDLCAPQIILEEAGGMIVCTEKGKPLSYNKDDLSQPDFFAMGKLEAYYEY